VKEEKAKKTAHIMKIAKSLSHNNLSSIFSIFKEMPRIDLE
jgi:hypothetical protein